MYKRIIYTSTELYMCTRGLYTPVIYINTGNGQKSHRDICSMSVNFKKNTKQYS